MQYRLTTRKGVLKMQVKEIYKQEARYNSRIRATVGGAWIAVLANGDEFPVCRDYEAKSEADVRAILAKR
jgi:hypothetical protein